RLANQPLLDFVNATLRGISQVIFVNNPLSGLLILTAMFIQSPWLGVMSLVGTATATLMAIALKANQGAIQNGIFGLNGMLVGAAMAFFGAFGNGTWNPVWANRRHYPLCSHSGGDGDSRDVVRHPLQSCSTGHPL
ncbi:MAG: urea transporter, partial [Potamolinea sp.]